MTAHINLFNTSFVLHSDEDNEYIQKLISYIENKVDLVEQDVQVEDPLKKAILTLLLISHEVNELKATLHEDQNFTLHSMQQIINLLNTSETSQTDSRESSNIPLHNIEFIEAEPH